MAALFPLEVHTPTRIFFSEPIEVIVLTLIDGEAAVYANHSHFTAPVVPCLFKIKDKDGQWKSAFTAEGILQVGDLRTVLLSDAAEWPDEIDYERAKAALERAEETINMGTFKFETEAAVSALQRAKMRIKVSEEGKL